MGSKRTRIQRHGGTKSNTRHRSVQPIIIEREAPEDLEVALRKSWEFQATVGLLLHAIVHPADIQDRDGVLVPGTCTRKRLRIRSAKRTPNTVGARILRKKTLRCKNTLKMCRLCFVIKVSNAPGLGAMNSLGAQTARRVKRLAARIVGCIIRLFAEDAADVNGRLHRCQVESERTVGQSHLRSMLLSPSWRWLEIAITG